MRVQPADAPAIHGMERGSSHVPLLSGGNQGPPPATSAPASAPPMSPGAKKHHRFSGIISRAAYSPKGAVTSKGAISSKNIASGNSSFLRDGDIEENIEALKDGEQLPLENYIPFRYTELRDRIIQDHPEMFGNMDATMSFKKFCRWLNLRNQAKLALQYQHIDEMYVLLDPDTDGPPPGHLASLWPDKSELVEAYLNDLAEVLAISEFDPVTKADMEKAYLLDGPSGLSVSKYDDSLLDVRLWHRGHRIEPVRYRSWRTLYFEKTVEMPVYQRLVMIYRLRPDAEEQYRAQSQRLPLWKRCLNCCTCQSEVNVKNNGTQLSSEYLYMRLYKDIQHADIDMLLPGAVIHFTWVDWLFVWVPIAVGVGVACYKIATNTLVFDTLFHIATALALILGPLVYGVSAYMNIKSKAEHYAAYINQLVIMHNICSNESVMYQLLDEAQEQEDSEALLAYFFLLMLQQKAEMGAVTEGDLDRQIETYLSVLIKECGHLEQVRIDFDVSGAVEKLRVYRVLTVDKECSAGGQEGGKTRLLKVKSLPEAEQLTHLKYFDEKIEVPGFNFARSGLSAAMRNAMVAGEPLSVSLAELAQVSPGPDTRASSVWREVLYDDADTGEKNRYFYNEATNETTNTPPPEYVPHSASTPGAQRTPSSRVPPAGPPTPTTPSAYDPASMPNTIPGSPSFRGAGVESGDRDPHHLAPATLTSSPLGNSRLTPVYRPGPALRSLSSLRGSSSSGGGGKLPPIVTRGNLMLPPPPPSPNGESPSLEGGPYQLGEAPAPSPGAPASPFPAGSPHTPGAPHHSALPAELPEAPATPGADRSAPPSSPAGGT